MVIEHEITSVYWRVWRYNAYPNIYLTIRYVLQDCTRKHFYTGIYITIVKYHHCDIKSFIS